MIEGRITWQSCSWYLKDLLWEYTWRGLIFSGGRNLLVVEFFSMPVHNHCVVIDFLALPTGLEVYPRLEHSSLLISPTSGMCRRSSGYFLTLLSLPNALRVKLELCQPRYQALEDIQKKAAVAICSLLSVL